MAISKPNLTRIWAADAAGSDVVDPDVQTPGKFSLGWVAEKPPYQFFNFMQKLFTQGLGYFDEQGIGFWNTDTDYQDLSLTKGSNGVIYLLKTSGDGTQNPVSDGGTNWIVAAGKQFVTGTATFTNSTNNIALTGIGSIGLEIGDVVQVTGTASNNKLFTVEVITDSGNVIVNQAHAGDTTIKSLVNETVSATVTLLAKFYNAPVGLGQGWVSVLSSRVMGTSYTNNTGRSISVAANKFTLDNDLLGFVDNVEVSRSGSQTNGSAQVDLVPVSSASTYRISSVDSAVSSFNSWVELR